MELRDKIYSTYAEASVDKEYNLKLDKGDLMLVVNGYVTDININKLFVGDIKRRKTSIKGFSILQTHKIEDGFLVDGDNNKYSLWLPPSPEASVDEGTNLLFKEIYEPVIQDRDKKLSIDEYNDYIDVLIDGIKQSKALEKQDKVESVKEDIDPPPTPEASVDNNDPPTPKAPADEVELEDIIEELEEQGYDHFGKDQYNVFLQLNKKPVLYIGKEKVEYVSTSYDGENKANLTFVFNEKLIRISVEEDGITFPTSSTDLSTEDLSKVEAPKDEGGSSEDNTEVENDGLENQDEVEVTSKSGADEAGSGSSGVNTEESGTTRDKETTEQ